MNHLQTLALAIMGFLMFSIAIDTQADETATIAPEVARLIAEEGIEPARVRFKELMKSEGLSSKKHTGGMSWICTNCRYLNGSYFELRNSSFLGYLGV